MTLIRILILKPRIPERRCKCTLHGISGPFRSAKCLPKSIHLLDQLVDLLFSIAQVAAFDEMLKLPLLEAAVGVVELEWPQEI